MIAKDRTFSEENKMGTQVHGTIKSLYLCMCFVGPRRKGNALSLIFFLNPNKSRNPRPKIETSDMIVKSTVVTIYDDVTLNEDTETKVGQKKNYKVS